MKCAACSVEFVPARYNQKTCSPACSFVHDRNRARAYQREKNRLREKKVYPPAACEECGAMFIPRRRTSRHCSLKCCVRSARRNHKRKVARENLRRREAEGRRCDVCGRALPSKYYQQKRCPGQCDGRVRRLQVNRRRKRKRDTFPTVKCVECGVVFRPRDARHLCCSVACGLRRSHRIQVRARRARVAGVEFEKVDPFVVFERDRWRCQLCRRKTPKKLRGSMNPGAPELDHIIPISMGGSHTYRNSQLACRACNMAKGATPLGQLRLFG